jgi:hypothetical protein
MRADRRTATPAAFSIGSTAAVGRRRTARARRSVAICTRAASAAGFAPPEVDAASHHRYPLQPLGDRLAGMEVGEGGPVRHARPLRLHHAPSLRRLCRPRRVAAAKGQLGDEQRAENASPPAGYALLQQSDALPQRQKPEPRRSTRACRPEAPPRTAPAARPAPTRCFEPRFARAASARLSASDGPCPAVDQRGDALGQQHG